MTFPSLGLKDEFHWVFVFWVISILQEKGCKETKSCGDWQQGQTRKGDACGDSANQSR